MTTLGQKDEPVPKIKGPGKEFVRRPPKLVKNVRTILVDVVCKETGMNKRNFGRFLDLKPFGEERSPLETAVDVIGGDVDAYTTISLSTEQLSVKEGKKLAEKIETSLGKKLEEYERVSVTVNYEETQDKDRKMGNITIKIIKKAPEVREIELEEEKI